MTTLHTADTPADEWYANRPALKEFVETARGLRARHAGDVSGLLGALEAPFRELLAASDWLPEAYAAVCESGGMGGGIGQWLLFREADHSLVLFSLVVPSGSATPVHDHHAWGLVGLYRGEQREQVYQRLTDMPAADGTAPLALAEERTVRPGDTYRLLPPHDDVHAVQTTSTEPSVSIHLLGTDAGCLWRHRIEPEAGVALPFRSGYTNVACAEDAAGPPAEVACA
jgi:predicted metal-dependent enzyme (double-stranded beta helix superfamily)